ncbi:hypothetical protein TrRE_jg12440 [Triparma retinervis]|uniref:peptidylprolyl isomerase n=1 Tax=Triparma retinervis TaxID=2557542 RepID=A0A9W7G1P2_9STRA|nr:hypothetical protein TrRE_jg12440 [Triparma retinervis]
MNCTAFTKMISVASAAPFIIALPVNAIDPALLKTLPTEGDATGGSSRLAEVARIQQGYMNADPEVVDVEDGVSYREYRVGNGDTIVSDGSRVGLEMTVRCSTVTSANEPNGAMIYSTSRDDDLGELLVKVGSGALPASIEKSLAGMSKGGQKRIYLSSERAYEWKNSGNLPMPKGDREKRIVDRVFKGKADLIVEVKVARVRGGVGPAASAAPAVDTTA